MSRILAPPVLPSFPTRRSSDLPRIKGIINALYKVLQKGTVRFIGNVDYGTDLSMADLRHYYDAVIFATGAIRDADLNIPGIDLHGSFGRSEERRVGKEWTTRQAT